MAEIINQHGVETWTIRSGDASATFIPAWGGIGSSLVLGGRELLFQHEWFWEDPAPRTRGGWPFLFPICGRLERGGEDGAYLVNGRRYQMPIHGFGPRVPWTANSMEGHALELRLESTEETLAQYPFPFRVSLIYSISGRALVCRQRYENTGDTPMPFYAGFHPYFATPAPGAGKEEVTVDHQPLRRLCYNETLTDVIGEAEAPAFPLPVTDDALNELLTEVPVDNVMQLRQADGFTIHMKATGLERKGLFPYAQHYTMDDKGFFCYEPWMGHPNALNTAAASVLLEPGDVIHGVAEVWTD